MTRPIDHLNVNRRQFLQATGSLAAGAAMMGSLSPRAFAGQDHTIRLALLGCGGRGTGAVGDALSVPNGGPIKLYAMADVVESRMTDAHKSLQERFGDKIDVPEDRRFIGFKGYQKAIDLLRPGDVAMCTTRSYIRPIHVEYAIKKGINVFMEKPFASDPGGLHRLLRAGEEAERKGVKVLAGVQCRHSPARQALIEKIRNGEMGEIPLIRANRLGGTGWLGNQGANANKLMSQLEFGRAELYWVGSGHMVDNLIHQIDECCWIKDAWPVQAVGLGGRVPRSQDHGQNIDVYSIEYTFADGTKAFCGFRRMNNCRNEFATFIHGTKCAAQFSGDVHAATVHMFKDQRIANSNIAWTPTKDRYSPWQYEWNVFIDSIRNDRPHNEVKRAVYSDLTSCMGRAACHTGQTITWDDMMKSRFQFCDYLDDIDYDSPPPVKADEDGWFPVPIPGQWTEI
ncbi:MAG TPA: twin-arginine translocation signal domain-containing protein [Sedimentisphaerales bacterium]|nr:twin-arginine translocation signal domain-containing protein [Sedimentisphaerales bacterium]HRS10034.1 twin-arginine translocation signal domain-containing protein [Sedimentisphaerales bacterium]HRV46740.1 twin-arginine translocation signal domain-containing protein [Sedimentisphaerales bacterium]